jgi:hypothetical protein
MPRNEAKVADPSKRKPAGPRERAADRKSKDDKPLPVTEATEHGIENADNAEYTDGHNIGP